MQSVPDLPHGRPNYRQEEEKKKDPAVSTLCGDILIFSTTDCKDQVSPSTHVQRGSHEKTSDLHPVSSAFFLCSKGLIFFLDSHFLEETKV